MVDALKNKEIDQSLMKRITLDANVIHNKTLEYFISRNTRRFYSASREFHQHFKKRNIEVQEEDEDYKTSKDIVCSMILPSEVALMEEYNKLHTTK